MKKTKLDYKMGQKVWFYLQDSLEVREGEIVGFFALIDEAIEKGNKNYTYQIEYYREQKDGTNKIFIGNTTSENISTDKKKIKEYFEGIRNVRIKTRLNELQIEYNGAKINKEHHGKAKKEIMKEIERIKKLQR